MDPKENKKRILAAYKLLTEETTTLEKFESVRTLLRGANPTIDKHLDNVSRAFSDLEKLHKGEVVELTAKHLPSKTEEEKRRKRALLLLIKSYKELQSGVERVKSGIERLGEDKTPSAQEKISTFGRILGFTKGTFSLLTLAALAVVGFQLLMKRQEEKKPVIQEQIIEETIGEEDSALSYWIKEAKVDAGRNQLVWSIHVHKESSETRKQTQDIPATDAIVTVKLEGGLSVIRSGTVGSDGWVRLTTSAPRVETSLYIVDVKGELPWAQKDKVFWKNRTAASYKQES